MNYDNWKLATPESESGYLVSSCCGAEYEEDDDGNTCLDCGDECEEIDEREYRQSKKDDWDEMQADDDRLEK